MKFILLIIFVLFFNSCGQGSSSENLYNYNSSNQNEKKYLTINKEERIYKGDKIVKDSKNAKVEIKHNLSTEITTVKLLSGAAHVE